MAKAAGAGGRPTRRTGTRSAEGPAPVPPASAVRADGRERLVVVGGGMAALSAVWELTHPDNPQRDRHAITVLQMGWRLGGKGASGRNAERGQRIEEHGIHNLFGFYDNAFRVVKGAYAELKRPAGAPHRTWREAFSPESTAVFLEDIDGQTRPWQVFNPTNAFEPGTGGAWLPLWDTLALALQFLDLNVVAPPKVPPGLDPPTRLRRRYVPAVAALHAIARLIGPLLDPAPPESAKGRAQLRAGLVAATAIRTALRALWPLIRGRVKRDDRVRRAWILAHLSGAGLAGVLRDGAHVHGLDHLNDRDFLEWIRTVAIDDGGIALDSVLVRVLYDSSFAYVHGDTDIPDGAPTAPHASYEAGTLLRGVVRAAFGYKGAFGWKMTAGCGDVIFAPLYQALRARGVSFRFFHAVTALEADTEGKGVAVLRVDRQVDVLPDRVAAGHGDAGYQPLVTVKGLPCWPSAPHWDQLEGGPALAAAGVDFESPVGGWQAVERLVWRRGEHFDRVILAVGLGALPHLAPDLIARRPAWQQMVRAQRTVRTEAAQVWLDRDLDEAGFGPKGHPIAGFWYGRRSPLNVWVDLSMTLPAEDWRADRDGVPVPRSVQYFVSPMADERPLPVGPAGPVDDAAGMAEGPAYLRVKGHLHDLMARHTAPRLFPALQARPDAPCIDWARLHDPSGATGAARLDAQYWRANTAPSDRYVLSVPGSSALRIGAHDADNAFDNLYLAGDWTFNGLNSGAMEAAALSGRLCAFALSGFPARQDIVGADVATPPWGRRP